MAAWWRDSTRSLRLLMALILALMIPLGGKGRTAAAEQPLTTVPPLAARDWVAVSDQEGAEMGAAVAGAGDVNGDGYQDVLVGAPSYDVDDDGSSEGAAFLYLGSAGGLAAAPLMLAPVTLDDAEFGTSVAGAGDVNGDGYADFIVGAPGHDPSGDELPDGAAYLYLGGPDLGAAPAPAAVLTMPSLFLENQFGLRVSGAGDVNGDGYSDVAVAAPGYEEMESPGTGAVFIYYGDETESGLAQTDPAQTLGLATVGNPAVAAAGDVNGDGYGDFLVGVSEFGEVEEVLGAAYLYMGGSAGLEADPAWAWQGGGTEVLLGINVAGVGDLNGDGYADIAVGELGGVLDVQGTVYVYPGSPSGPGEPWTLNDPVSDTNSIWFGSSLAGAGDLNGDGYGDLVVGGPIFGGMPQEGAHGIAAVYLGAPTGLGNLPTFILAGRYSESQGSFGEAVAGAGDVNGDGLADLLVGAPGHLLGEAPAGAAYLYPGTAAHLRPGAAGSDRADSAAAADFNGDGYSDLAAGDPFYTVDGATVGAVRITYGNDAGPGAAPDQVLVGSGVDSRFGAALAATDLDGDGYSDLVVGASDHGTGGERTGAIFIYRGGAAGLVDEPLAVAGDQAGSGFGSALAPAGDLNGDGRGDLLVGAPEYDSGFMEAAGAVHVYLGSSALDPAALTPAAVITGERGWDFLGEVLAPAGDLNGDGYSDFAVGFPYYMAQGEVTPGAVYIYYGADTPSGLAAGPPQMLVGD